MARLHWRAVAEPFCLCSPDYYPNSGATHNVRMDGDMHLVPEYDDRLNVDEVNVDQFVYAYAHYPVLPYT